MKRAPRDRRFLYLLGALMLLLAAYPYLPPTPLGSFLGGCFSLVVLVSAVIALRPQRKSFAVALVLASVAAVLSVVDLAMQAPAYLIEAAFTLFYGFVAVAVVKEVLSHDEVQRDVIRGSACGYLLMGLAFATRHDFIDSVHPGSFVFDESITYGGELHWRHFVYYSFMTLTTVGYGDVTPGIPVVQSVAIFESVFGVLYVAILVARLVARQGHR